MSQTPNDRSTVLPGRPPVVDMATWESAREELLLREKAHTHEGDAIAAARRRLPMVEIDGTVEVVGPDGPVPFLDLFQGRDELVVYQHMWYDGAPHQGQCEGCTTTAWHLKDAIYLNARGVSFAVLTTGRWPEVAEYVGFMGYTQPWYSVRGLESPIGGSMGWLSTFLRDGDRVFVTYRTTGRGTEIVNGSMALLDLTPYGRREAWEDNPEGWPEPAAIRSEDGAVGAQTCWYWRTNADGEGDWGPTSRPAPQWTRPGATPAGSLGRRGDVDEQLPD
ncbi:DUF899 family protein [Georgenia faecalis]|uniref:DUF899 family protein n=1 Tax=Georgenia faecalis TaxID=2483799 RepID=UPI000FD6F4CB|nr:DUF899 family protein [Georgenia faecalis]